MPHETAEQVFEKFFEEARKRGWDSASCYAYASGALMSSHDDLRCELEQAEAKLRQTQEVCQ